MSEEIKDSQQAKDQATDVKSTTQDAVIDWENKYQEEVKSSKGYRLRAQKAEGTLEKNNQTLEKARTVKMEEDGKFKELIAEQNQLIETLKVKADAGDQLLKDRHTQLLEQLPEVDREDFADLPAKQLEKVVNKFKATELIKPEIPSVKGAIKNVSLDKPYASMTEAEREQWHNDTFASLKHK